MRTFLTALLAALLTALVGLAHAESASVVALRLADRPSDSRLELELSAPVQYKAFSLQRPERLVFDLQNARAVDPEFRVDIQGGVVHGLRSAARGDGVRVVLDLNAKASHTASLIPPKGSKGHRLVVEVKGRGAAPAASAAPKHPSAAAPAPAQTSSQVSSQRPAVASVAAKAVAASGGQMRDIVISPKAPEAPKAVPLRDLVIAIDAGHGGKDPGATGPRGTREKDVVLAISKKLRKLINDEPGMRATMVRPWDRYIKLRDRIGIARERKADLFISIHADSFRDYGAHGSSVYILSPDGASSEAARWLAESENQADLIGGVTLDDKEQMVASVLLDMSQTRTIEESSAAAKAVLRHLKGVGKLHSRRVQRAGFAVLKSPDIPSMLVETGFLSNPMEEKKLNDPAHQRKIARAVLAGVRAYFNQYAPPGTWIAEGKRPPKSSVARASAPKVSGNIVRTTAPPAAAPKRHTIRDGETLFGIARKYRVNVSSLKLVNGLKEDGIIRVGQRLLIPVRREGA